MKNRFENIDEIIAKYLTGEANAEETALLNEWKMASEENRKEFEQFNKLFNTSSSLKDILSVDTDSAWLNVQKSISQSKNLNPGRSNIRALWSPFFRIAAILILLAGIAYSIFIINSNEKKKMITVNSIELIRNEKLPDGSTITLNKNSSISYSSNTFNKKRTVHLDGEAFFDVKHNDANPFVVEASGIKITDVGTSFNVKAIKGTNLVIISVISGEVNVTAVNRKELMLTEGEEASYDVNSGTFTKSGISNPNISAYANHVFIFENAELATVFKVLNDIYTIKLKAENDSLLGCRISVTFDNESLDEISAVIAETLGLELTLDKDTIIFKGNACKQ